VEIERGADADHGWGIDAVEVVAHPLFLLGRSQADPHDVRLSGVDVVDELLIFRSGQLAERRATRARDDEAGVVRGHSPRELFGDALGSTIEVMAEISLAAAIAKKHSGDWRDWHKIRAWAKDVAHLILDEEPKPVVILPAASHLRRRLVAALCIVVGFTTILYATQSMSLQSHPWLQLAILTLSVLILVVGWKAFELPWRHGRAARYATR
jgi:hypothetical protein